MLALSYGMLPRRRLEAIAETLQGIPVLGCLQGGMAAQLGVRYGDIVIEVNGVRTPTIDEYVSARKLRSDGVSLRLFRDGEEVAVFIPFQPRSDEQNWEMLVELLAEGRFVGGTDPSPQEPEGPSN